MKNIFTLVLNIFFFAGFSQTENDVREIVQLVVTTYQSDTINVYHKFDNHELSNRLFSIKMSQETKIYEQVLLHPDSLSADRRWEIVGEQQSDTATISIEGIKIFYNTNYSIAESNDDKKLSRFFKSDYQKRRRKLPLAYISTPIIAADNKKAFVYWHINSGLYGNGGILFLEKINNNWQIVSTNITVYYER